MARTIAQIKTELTEAFMTDSTLQAKYGFSEGDKFDSRFSKVSIENLLLYIVATAIWTLEKLMDSHTAEMTEYIAAMKPHSLRWYVEKAKAFHYGESLIPGTDKYALADDDEGVVMPVTFAACTESNATLYLKVAKRGPEPLTDEEKSAFEAYMREIKDAGVRIDVTSQDGDYLRLDMTVFYNPLLITAEGESKADGSKVAELAIKNYIENLPFNGEFRKNEMVDALQNTPGIVMVELGNVYHGEISSNIKPVTAYCQPVSGYFKGDRAELNIQYVPYDN